MTGENPPEDQFPFLDLQALLAQSGGQNPWDMAAQVAASIASEGNTEPNLDPNVRFEFEDLVRVAELHLRQVPGLTLPPKVRIEPTTRTGWTQKSLSSYRPLFERFSEALSEAPEDPEINDPSDPMSAMIGQAFNSLGPMLVTISAGSMLGHLAQQTLGQYDLPIPRDSDEILVVPAAIDAAAANWDLTTNDLRLWVIIHEMAAHSVLSIPHVRKRLEALLLDFASAFRPNFDMITEQFGTITDMNQIEEMSQKFNNPDAILSMMRSPAHDLIMPQLDALVASILGYVDHVVSLACAPLLPNHQTIRTHFRQRWLDATPADRFTERLLGLEIDASTLQRGDDFVSGILDRAGQDGLNQLWRDELDMPTAAEVNAPGLWLARVGLDADGEEVHVSVPDDLSSLDGLAPMDGSDPDPEEDDPENPESPEEQDT